MSAIEIEVDHGPADARPGAPAEDIVKLAKGPQSILDAVRGQVDIRTRKATVVLPVGVVARLTCRYRALSDERRDQIGEQVNGSGHATLSGAAREAAAVVLASAAESLLWDGEPLHELLEMDGPLRYGREVAELLELDVGDKPSTVDVVVALHTLGESTAPLETAAEEYLSWLTGKRASAVEWAVSN